MITTSSPFLETLAAYNCPSLVNIINGSAHMILGGAFLLL